ncbi:osmotically inducible protein OsmC [Streptococcus sp. zg-86]|uniref:Osmotically inducible protein OsmC n=1 Tax=Streptococcus zhangguiae TaxID=2664091 RepID=A0A6I4RHM6_9STRE|nr:MULTISPECIES: OsmC family protein [unclassified Streptococcus]MTB64991.1 osmotically inducible protein OsmC [Streptococcus sp. zg-86]MTB91205.1 osmotically inducible protein OsmC [Streptococcus sp. zg-36]MWV56924.1 osmotically inducible protein OsmC [Streptococcus sp. zg-70]QTH47164.1 OsmC family protein [Streptococcus sp. zg-86]
MLYSVTATNHEGIHGSVSLSSEKSVPTAHPLTKEEGFNPEELMATAWATCLNATIQALLESQKQERQSRVEVTCELHREARIGTGYFFQVNAKASIEGLTTDQSETIVQQAHQRCPISKLISQSQTISLQTVEWDT